MDPFIESQAWENFHHEFISGIRETLTAHLRPRYVVKVELRIYLEHALGGQSRVIQRDVALLEPPEGIGLAGDASHAGAAAEVQPVILALPVPERRREAFLTISTRDQAEVITVIEVLSPSNKRIGSDGRREYLNKRDTILGSATHLVEMDLLRAGERLPTIDPLPPAHFYVFVSRVQQRPNAEVFPWTLRHRLPTISVPLAESDPEVALDLQQVFTTVYDRSGYDYALDYQRPIEPPLAEADAGWVARLLLK